MASYHTYNSCLETFAYKYCNVDMQNTLVEKHQFCSTENKMNIIILLAAISVTVYGETCESNNNQYSDKIEVQESCEVCNYTSCFADESIKLRKELVSPHGNDENYKLKAAVSLNAIQKHPRCKKGEAKSEAPVNIKTTESTGD